MFDGQWFSHKLASLRSVGLRFWRYHIIFIQVLERSNRDVYSVLGYTHTIFDKITFDKMWPLKVCMLFLVCQISSTYLTTNIISILCNIEADEIEGLKKQTHSAKRIYDRLVDEIAMDTF
jgi:hypothetical protein